MPTTNSPNGSSESTYTIPICTEILIKLAMRCNIACTYCYWFRDKNVYAKPAILQEAAEQAFLAKLSAHLQRHDLKRFHILFHGGEPLLFGLRRFRRLCHGLWSVGEHTGADIGLSLTTNGLLLNRDWLELLRRYDVSIGISIDGPAAVHDRRRVDSKGRGTYERVTRSIDLARAHGIEPGVLAVCDPSTSPEPIISHFVDDLGITSFDVLVPDLTHADTVTSIAEYYTTLFDLWYYRYARRGVRIRYFEAMITGLLGGNSKSQVIGLGPITSVTLLTDGSLEALDTLRTAGDGATAGKINILTHELQDIAADTLWREIWSATTTLPAECRSCEIVQTCGGGHIASRWSPERRYDNPSVYCNDIKVVVDYVWRAVSKDLYLEFPDATAELASCLT